VNAQFAHPVLLSNAAKTYGMGRNFFAKALLVSSHDSCKHRYIKCPYVYYLPTKTFFITACTQFTMSLLVSSIFYDTLC